MQIKLPSFVNLNLSMQQWTIMAMSPLLMMCFLFSWVSVWVRNRYNYFLLLTRFGRTFLMKCVKKLGFLILDLGLSPGLPGARLSSFTSTSSVSAISSDFLLLPLLPGGKTVTSISSSGAPIISWFTFSGTCSFTGPSCSVGVVVSSWLVSSVSVLRGIDRGGAEHPFHGTYDDFSKIETKITTPPFSQTDSQKSTLVLFEIRPRHPTTLFLAKKSTTGTFRNLAKRPPPPRVLFEILDHPH